MHQAQVNPYAAPVSDYGPGQAATPGMDFYRSGDKLIIRKGTTLPANCIATGSQGAGQLKTKTHSWGPPWVIAIAVLISPLIGLILYFILRKTGSFTFFISDQAAAKRKKGITAGLVTVAVSILLFVLAVPLELPALMILGFVGLFTGIIVASVVGRPYHVTKIDKTHIHLKLKNEFWNALPNVPGAPYQLPGT